MRDWSVQLHLSQPLPVPWGMTVEPVMSVGRGKGAGAGAVILEETPFYKLFLKCSRPTQNAQLFYLSAPFDTTDQDVLITRVST